MAMQIKGAVKCRLTAHGRQYGIGFLGRNNAFDHFPSNRLDISDICHLWVGHDGGRITIHQNDAIALFT